jgi:hypothetical protein
MDDRELLEAAAKAAGIDAEFHPELGFGPEGMWLKGARSPDNSKYWNPLAVDGDALRLASALRIDIGFHLGHVRAHPRHKYILYVSEDYHTHPTIEAATRRAIVRAAAALAPHPSKSKGETE